MLQLYYFLSVILLINGIYLTFCGRLRAVVRAHVAQVLAAHEAEHHSPPRTAPEALGGILPRGQ